MEHDAQAAQTFESFTDSGSGWLNCWGGLFESRGDTEYNPIVYANADAHT